jgi:hypothetical protein
MEKIKNEMKNLIFFLNSNFFIIIGSKISVISLVATEIDNKIDDLKNLFLISIYKPAKKKNIIIPSP